MEELRSKQDRFTKMLKVCERQLYLYARKVTGSSDEADELCGVVYYRAWMFFDSWREEAAFQAWIQVIMRNTCLNWVKTQKYTKDHSLSLTNYSQRGGQYSEEESVENDLPDFRSNPELVYFQDLRMRILRDEIGRLPSDMGVPFQMRLDGHTYIEIGHILHLDVSTVKTRIFRARERLRCRLSLD